MKQYNHERFCLTLGQSMIKGGVLLGDNKSFGFLILMGVSCLPLFMEAISQGCVTDMIVCWRAFLRKTLGLCSGLALESCESLLTDCCKKWSMLSHHMLISLTWNFHVIHTVELGDTGN